MELVDSYLRAVKRYLPRAQRKDIIAELSVELRSQIDERQAELGRPLSDVEQYTILKEHGDPMVVARRYWPERRSLAIGWELIGPELFPMYLVLMTVNLTITLIAVPIGLMIYHVRVTAGEFVVPVLAQIICVTLTFMILNVVRRKCPQPWFYPPAELARMLPVSRGYSISGLILFVLLTSWWLLLPRFNFLILGGGVGTLKLTPIWERYYLPVSLLLLASLGQRVMNLARPTWTWLVPTARFFIDSVGTVVMFFFRTHTLVQLADGVPDSPHVQHVAVQFNSLLIFGIFGPWLWIYLAVSTLVYAWYCWPHLRRALHPEHNRQSPVINAVI